MRKERKRIAIEDNGIGMEKKEFEKIKRYFYEQCITFGLSKKQKNEIIGKLGDHQFKNIYYLESSSELYNRDTGINFK